MESENNDVLNRCWCSSIRQIHNALKGGAGRDQIANVGKGFVSCTDQIIQDRNRHKYDHHDFNINHAYHHAIGEFAYK